MDIVEQLNNIALIKSKNQKPDKYIIKGVWDTNIFLKPNKDEVLFSTPFIMVQTTGVGCCYHSKRVKLSNKLIGKDARFASYPDLYTTIAALDSIFSNFKKSPSNRYVLEGSPLSKIMKRTRIITTSVLECLYELSGKKKNYSVALVGAVGNFIKSINKYHNINIYVSDLDRLLRPRRIHGIKINNGHKTLENIKRTDVTLVTGMTLATNSLEDILKTVNEYNKKLIMYAQTGANFASEYLKMGIDVVIAEYFPFYVFPGKSIIEIYNKGIK